MNRKPRFFCDNCGDEVGHKVKSCPRCGRFFASVRCPSCGLVGDEGTFTGGCPSCGYSAPRPGAAQPAGRGQPRKALPFWARFLCLCLSVLAAAILFLYITG